MQERSRPDIGRPVFFNSERLKVSVRHPEDHVALKRSLGCRHLDCASSRTSWYVGRDQGSRDHFEDRRCAVKRDASCAGQIRSQNLDSRSHLAGGRLCFHKRAQTYRQAYFSFDLQLAESDTLCDLTAAVFRLSLLMA